MFSKQRFENMSRRQSNAEGGAAPADRHNAASVSPAERKPMYIPAHFSETRPEVLHELMRQHPFAALVTHGALGLDANHIPFELDASRGELGVLSAHVARANPVWQELADGDEVLVIFRAADAYVSPNWYPSKHELHKQVPTWNYMVAHAHGRITIRDDERYVRGVVARLTRTHEASQPAPWKWAIARRTISTPWSKPSSGLRLKSHAWQASSSSARTRKYATFATRAKCSGRRAMRSWVRRCWRAPHQGISRRLRFLPQKLSNIRTSRGPASSMACSGLQRLECMAQLNTTMRPSTRRG